MTTYAYVLDDLRRYCRAMKNENVRYAFWRGLRKLQTILKINKTKLSVNAEAESNALQVGIANPVACSAPKTRHQNLTMTLCPYAPSKKKINCATASGTLTGRLALRSNPRYATPKQAESIASEKGINPGIMRKNRGASKGSTGSPFFSKTIPTSANKNAIPKNSFAAI
jgi:hypothetical protein